MNIINRFINDTLNFTILHAGYYGKVVDFQDAKSIILTSSHEDWKYIYIFLHIFRKYQAFSGWLKTHKKFDLSTKSVGSFLIQNIGKYVKYCEGNKIDQLKKLHNLFTLPDQSLSLPHLTFMYSSNDFRVLLKNSIESYDDILYQFQNNNFSILLEECIRNVASEKFNEDLKVTIDGEELDPFKYLEASPCLNISLFPQCNSYCNWHKVFFNKFPKNEFITIMKYALPQRKLSLDSNLVSEKKIAKKIFGMDAKMDLKYFMTASPLMLFCYKKDKGFIGDDLGMFARACNQFFPTPTDQGICFTKNINIKDVMVNTKSYESLFDQESQNSNLNKMVGTSEKESTLIFFTGYPTEFGKKTTLNQNDFRIPYNEEIGEVQFQLHQSEEIAHLLPNNNFRRTTKSSLILKAARKYHIEITPEGEMVTDTFKSLSLKQRKCHLENEVFDNSIFKTYTKRNCEYECHVKLAEQICKCIPWDYLHNRKSPECDVFGRTCFYNAMENLTISNKNHCSHCINGCDHITYNAIIKEEKVIGKYDIFELITHTCFNQQIPASTSVMTLKPVTCTGEKIFCDFFLPYETNGTMIDKGMENAFNTMGCRPDFITTRSEMANDMVIVHLTFLKPEVDVIDVRYSWLDKFANIGGNYGIFAEITGCSLLIILNVLILFFKLPFSSNTQ